MLIIDGNQSTIDLKSFGNLEELLVNVMDDDALASRVITDVLVDNESFSEIYPHQAEDIETGSYEKVEIISVPVKDMAVNITRELYKVIGIMGHGGRQVADLFRKADDAEALEVYQDLLDVTRDFLGMIAVLREEFILKKHQEFHDAAEEINNLFGEMSEVMENEDWILLSDLLEYEFIPATEKWKKVIALIREDIREN